MAVLNATFFEEVLTESGGSGRYVNLSKIDGEKRLRYMGHGISGYTAWTTENKPVRWELKPEELPDNIKPDMNGSIAAKKFMAGVVWDYDDSEFKILELTQISVLKQLAKYLADEDYGDWSQYDIKIARDQKGEKITYTLLAAPPKPVKPEIFKQYESMPEVNLDALYEGKDPWAAPSA